MITSCVSSTYGISYIDKNTARINSYGGEYEGQDYANACFMIGAADFTLNQGANYFVVLTQDTKVDSNSYTSPSEQIGTTKKGLPIMYGGSTTITNTYSKSGVVRVFEKKPESEYVLPYNARYILSNYDSTYLCSCRTGGTRCPISPCTTNPNICLHSE